jgi:predicted HNH restriction endonuclease
MRGNSLVSAAGRATAKNYIKSHTRPEAEKLDSAKIIKNAGLIIKSTNKLIDGYESKSDTKTTSLGGRLLNWSKSGSKKKQVKKDRVVEKFDEIIGEVTVLDQQSRALRSDSAENRKAKAEVLEVKRNLAKAMERFEAKHNKRAATGGEGSVQMTLSKSKLDKMVDADEKGELFYLSDEVNASIVRNSVMK